MKTIAIFLLAFVVCGCGSTLKDVQVDHAKGAGTTRLYEVPLERAFTIATDVLKKEGAAIVSRPEPNELLAKIEASIVPYRMATNCGVWIEAQDAGHSRVTVVTKRESMTFATGLTEGTFHDDFAKAVASPVSSAP